MASALETYRSEEHNGPIFLETNKTKPQAVWLFEKRDNAENKVALFKNAIKRGKEPLVFFKCNKARKEKNSKTRRP